MRNTWTGCERKQKVCTWLTVKSMKICDVTHYPAVLLKDWTPSRLPAIFLHSAGTASNKAQQLLFLAHRGPSAGQDRSWRGGGLKLITLFNKRPTSPVLVLFSLTFLCLFDLSLTALCTDACGIGVLLAVQCDRNDQRVLSAIHCNRHLWNGRDEERRWMTRNWFVSADCVCQS